MPLLQLVPALGPLPVPVCIDIVVGVGTGDLASLVVERSF